MTHDIIIARASAPGSAFRGIVRVCGPNAVAAVKTIVEFPDAVLPSCLCVKSNITLPAFPPFPAQLLLWKEGQSYTGDETVEIHTIGSPVLLDAVMSALLSASDLVRLARPGEFTLRAFLSGRLDLAQAEAVLGVIDAASEADLKTALHQLAGNVSAPLSAVRRLLFETLTEIEASLDFVEEDVPTVSAETVQSTLTDAIEQVEQIQRQLTHRGLAEGKPKVVLTGPANAGKSTLFNKLAGRDVALVSPLAGTTRDYLEAEINWAGIPVVLIDTAGVEDGSGMDELDAAAQRKVQALLKQADVVIYCDEHSPLTRVQRSGDVEAGTSPLCTSASVCEKTIYFQTKTGEESLESLFQQVGMLLHRSPACGLLPSTTLRCRESLILAVESLRRATGLTDSSLLALELRCAVNQLGLIDGTIHTEDILENIFSRFCIGK